MVLIILGMVFFLFVVAAYLLIWKMTTEKDEAFRVAAGVVAVLVLLVILLGIVNPGVMILRKQAEPQTSSVEKQVQE